MELFDKLCNYTPDDVRVEIDLDEQISYSELNLNFIHGEQSYNLLLKCKYILEFLNDGSLPPFSIKKAITLTVLNNIGLETNTYRDRKDIAEYLGLMWSEVDVIYNLLCEMSKFTLSEVISMKKKWNK